MAGLGLGLVQVWFMLSWVKFGLSFDQARGGFAGWGWVEAEFGPSSKGHKHLILKQDSNYSNSKKVKKSENAIERPCQLFCSYTKVFSTMSVMTLPETTFLLIYLINQQLLGTIQGGR